MLLGKRPRPPVIKRTTSLKEFTLDPATAIPLNYQQQPFDPHNPLGPNNIPRSNGQDQRSLLTRRKSADFVETAHFLRACSLCERQLIPGHDIYMYRGDSAFCSLDCREKQMNQDERKEKGSFAAARKKITPPQAKLP
ncbi:FCS-Like Zinc finger 6-like [Lycium ferocissimum]|uniref:FCS-Like Zinc finger 6-like n=1 Tax=Lycium ferocissimum TaxID=112874 RepID=UPI002815F856|nr:FCS-Like Zinc finger 6-like [Lycium ferocissimum]